MNLRTLVLPLPLLCLGGCGGDHAHEGEPAATGHAHAPVHPGGVLVELGNHQAQLEVALDAEAGHLTLWVWNGEVDRSIRLTDASVPVEITLGDETFNLDCAAQESAVTGQKVGDSSEFKGSDERLKGASHVEARVASLTVQGSTYRDLVWHLPPADEH